MYQFVNFPYKNRAIHEINVIKVNDYYFYFLQVNYLMVHYGIAKPFKTLHSGNYKSEIRQVLMTRCTIMY